MSLEWLSDTARETALMNGFVKAELNSGNPKKVVESGENYNSDLSKVDLLFYKENGALVIKTVILKEGDNVHEGAKNAIKSHFLITEHSMYKEVLPSLERELIGINQELLWPQCLGHLDGNKIVMEDLEELGYRMADRQKGLDYHQAVMAVVGLAKFHAASLKAIKRGTIDHSSFSKFIFGGDFTLLDDFFGSSFDGFYMAIKDTWSGEWKDIIERIGRLSSKAVSIVKKMRQSTAKLNVLNHGDPWCNNMMFTYKNSSSVPSSIRFVDFQLSHYGSFAFDLQYFFNTSLSSDLIPLEDRLLLEYTETLRSCMNALELDNAPTYAEVLAEMTRTEFFGLFTAVAIAPHVTAPSSLAPPKFTNSETMSLEEMEMRKAKRYRTSEFTRRLQIILRKAQHGGMFERIQV